MKNIVWHNTSLSRSEREQIKNQKGVCLWFTGLSGSGKSTLANLAEAELNSGGYHTYLLDGDNIRHGLNKDLGFSDADREENIRRIGEVAGLFVDAGIIILTAFISPFRKDRDSVRKKMPNNRFVEIFVDTDINTCESRDPKGLYKKARKGELSEFTGISSPYEPPPNPEILLKNNNDILPSDNVEMIFNYLRKHKFLR